MPDELHGFTHDGIEVDEAARQLALAGERPHALDDVTGAASVGGDLLQDVAHAVEVAKSPAFR